MKPYVHAEFVVSLIQQHFGDDVIAAEIGVRAGEFSEVLLQSCPDLLLVGVDSYPEYQDGPVWITREMQDGWRRELETRVHPYRENQRFELQVMDSLQAAEKTPNGFYDIVFIDSCHTYEAALADIKAWYPKIRQSGILCGHDYKWEGVERAVNEFAKERGLSKQYQEVFKLGMSDVWWFRKPFSPTPLR